MKEFFFLRINNFFHNFPVAGTRKKMFEKKIQIKLDKILEKINK